MLEKEFDPNTLWPRAPFAAGVHPTARKRGRLEEVQPDGTTTVVETPSYMEVMAANSGMPGGDIGALRVRGGVWEIFLGIEWQAFNPTDPMHDKNANMFHRYGFWSFGDPRADDGQAYITYFNEVNHRDVANEPGWWGSMEHMDLIYNLQERDRLFEAWKKIPGNWPPVIVAPPTTPPVTPPPSVPGSGSLAALQTIKNLCETEAASLPTKGGGAPINALRSQYRRFLGKLIDQAKLGGALMLLLCLLPLLGCGTLRPVKETPLPGQSGGSSVRRFITAILTHSTMRDEVFEGASVESIDAGDVAGGLVGEALRPRLGELGPVVGELVGARLIEKAGSRAWSVKVVGDPADGQPRWFYVRPGANAADVAGLPPNQPVRIYARRVEVPGVVSALIVTRWTRK